MEWHEQFKLWLYEICPTWYKGNLEGLEEYVQLRYTGTGEQQERIDAQIYTESTVYHLYATATWLSCEASSRKMRPGESWHRGNDRHDGKFSQETWDEIVRDILRYELVKLADQPTQPPTPEITESESVKV